MKIEEKIVNFDLSTLSLSELIKVYENITIFSQYLNEKEIKQEEKSEE